MASKALSKSMAPIGLKVVPGWNRELKFIKDFFSIMLVKGRIWLEWQNFKFPMESTDSIFFSSKVGLMPPVNLNFPMLTCKIHLLTRFHTLILGIVSFLYYKRYIDFGCETQKIAFRQSQL
jgi:hypothetical protein